MKIPIVSTYLERKRATALEEIGLFREFFNQRVNPSYEVARTVLASINDATPISSVRKMRREIRSKCFYGGPFYEDFLKRLQYFQRLSPADKERFAYDNRMSYSVKTISNGLEQWAKKAESLLAKAIEQTPDKFEGFEYFDHIDAGNYGEGAIYKRIVNKNGKLTTNSFSTYGDHNYHDETSGKLIASSILKQIMPDYLRGGYAFVVESDGTNNSIFRRREIRVLNQKRNKIVNEVKRRTGRDLKKEVAEI